MMILHLPKESYGSMIRSTIEELNQKGTPVPEVHGYVRRLEREGYILSTWDRHGSHRVKFLSLTSPGRQYAQARIAQWLELQRRLEVTPQTRRRRAGH